MTALMTLYRVSERSFQLGHRGYTYFTARGTAERWMKRRLRDKEDREDISFELDEIKVRPTKRGIWDALNQYGGHNDNG